MKRAGFQRKKAPPRREAKQIDYTPRPRPIAAAAGPALPLAAPQPKEDRFTSESWRRAVASLPCVFCGAPAQAAHRNVGKGLGLKTDDSLVAALCPPDHAEIDQGKAMTREQRRAELDRAIVLTVRELARRGWLRVSMTQD
jgi:hypothetical protein